METRNEKWQSLRLEAQKFAPQEYFADCYRWILPLVCTGGSTSGDHYVFNSNNSQNDNPAIGQVTHPGHTVTPPLMVWTDSSSQPSLTDPAVLEVLATVGEFPGVMGNDQNTHGNPSGARTWMKNKLGEYVAGYAWFTNGELHFHAGEMEWQLQHHGTGSTPNAS